MKSETCGKNCDQWVYSCNFKSLSTLFSRDRTISSTVNLLVCCKKRIKHVVVLTGRYCPVTVVNIMYRTTDKPINVPRKWVLK